MLFRSYDGLEMEYEANCIAKELIDVLFTKNKEALEITGKLFDEEKKAYEERVDEFLNYVKYLDFSLNTIYDKQRKKISVKDLSDLELKSRILSLDLFNKNPFETKEEKESVPKEDCLKKEQFILDSTSLGTLVTCFPKVIIHSWAQNFTSHFLEIFK